MGDDDQAGAAEVPPTAVTPMAPSSAPAGSAEPGEIDPRLHYANERTYLAWIRTALALITAGLVVTQLLPAFKVAGGRRIVGLPLIGLGIVLALVAFRNWDANEQAMRARRALPRSRLPLVVAIGVAAVALAALVLAALGGVGP